jgi:hypothetical protein
MSYATVWLNGRLVGGWPFGYTSWRVDLTPYIVPGGPNQLAIRLDNPPSSSRWYPGGGIHRHVWLTKTQPLHVGHWGTHVRSRQVSSASATIDVGVTIDNDSSRGETVSVATRVYALDQTGERVGNAVATIAPVDITVASRSNADVSGSATIVRPRLWGDEVVYEPGRLEVVTYKDGRKWAIADGRTAGSAAALELRADRSALVSDGVDLSFVTAGLVDDANVLVPRGRVGVRFAVDGPGEIVATDNGDPTSFTPFQSHERETFNGLALAIVRARQGAGGRIHGHRLERGNKDGRHHDSIGPGARADPCRDGHTSNPRSNGQESSPASSRSPRKRQGRF